jgi:hypothetical protein
MNHSPVRATPPGWSYNPSAWSERMWIAALAVGGLAVSGYLALYQLKVFDHV